jgi:L-fuculose-phosphate aldolase
MRKVITEKDILDMQGKGQSLASLPADALYTPSARDLLRTLDAVPAGSSPAPAGRASSSSSQNEYERIFNSPEAQRIKEEICEIGRRLWAREYVDGNGGNISYRVGENLAICTPTLVSKGFMKPEDMCLVDLDGNQKAGIKKRTSEILMHLQIMKAQPKATAVVHCHPPHATGFAVAGISPPTCMIPEIEVFIGEVPVAPYMTPGTPELGKHIAGMTQHHNTILMANHGVVAWSKTVEDAYFKMEIVEAYCKTVLVAAQLGQPLKTFNTTQLQDLLTIKKTLDIPDRRHGLKECELCDNNEWRPGVSCAIPPRSENGNGHSPLQDTDAEAEKLVHTVTDLILQQLKR